MKHTIFSWIIKNVHQKNNFPMENGVNQKITNISNLQLQSFGSKYENVCHIWNVLTLGFTKICFQI